MLIRDLVYFGGRGQTDIPSFKSVISEAALKMRKNDEFIVSQSHTADDIPQCRNFAACQMKPQPGLPHARVTGQPAFKRAFKINECRAPGRHTGKKREMNRKAAGYPHPTANEACPCTPSLSRSTVSGRSSEGVLITGDWIVWCAQEGKAFSLHLVYKLFASMVRS